MWNNNVHNNNVITYLLLERNISFLWSDSGPIIISKKVLQIENSYPFSKKENKKALKNNG